MDAPEPQPWGDVRPHLEGVSRFAFDLEGDFNLHRYGRRICLFQIALDDGSVFLLDPLENGPKEPPRWPGWKELLESPQITKVIWAAQNDIRALRACHGIALKGLWDLFDAACLAVTPRPSLPLLTSTFLGLSMEKSEALQTSDWSVRPLTEAQRSYAALDVQYLLELADAVNPILDAKAKREAFQKRMVTAEAYEFAEVTEPWRKLKGSAALPPEAQLRLEEIWRFREVLAEELDLAPWKLVPPEELVFWAREGHFQEEAVMDPRWPRDRW